MSAPSQSLGSARPHTTRPSAETSPPAKPAPAGSGRQRAGHRPEIQGLRAVAVLLVAAYHIWLGRVSGGVDVFLMLTGFLITGSLLRTVERSGRVQFTAFVARLARRLFPPAALVLVGVLVGMVLWLPRTQWRDTLGEVFAAALYHENWRLALNAVDYLAGGADVSPVQHFWSLGIQGQFYLIWPALLVAAILVARVRASWTPRAVFLIVLTLVLAGSLAYSVWKTATDQPWAYFDTGARLWELALGGIAAIALPWLRVPRALRLVLGWLGLAALVSCGMLLQVSTMFPGYVALWPTGAAILIILAGQTDSRIGADRLLSARPLAYVGDISYALYLWHWPLLIFYRTKTGGDVGLLGGLGILAVSFALAAATTWVTDHAAGWAGKARATRRWSFTLGLACLLPVVLVAAGWAARLDERSRLTPVADDPARYPGARALTGGYGANLAVLPVRPEPSAARQDLPVIYADDCMQDTRKSDLVRCVYGAARPSRTIALVGNSHAVNWFPTLHAVADANRWRIVVLAKGSCMLADEPQIYKGRPQPTCDVWQQNVLAELKKLRPDLVITTATHSSGTEGEALTPGMVTRWRELDALGLRVLALRDTPRLPFKAPQCVETKGRDACTADKLYSLARVSPILALRDAPPNVKFSDFTPYLCRDGRCASVIGNVLVYWDSFGHFTATFARTLAPLLERQVELALQRDPSCMRPLPHGRCA